jgi:hypothetical protein
MDIPDFMKGKSVDDLLTQNLFAEALLTDANKGKIVGDGAMLEHFLTETLAAYRQTPNQPPSFSEASLSGMKFHEKIKKLAALALDPASINLRDSVVEALDNIRGIRNEAAHKAALTPAKIDALRAVPAYRKLLGNFPQSWDTAVSEVQARIQELQGTPHFRGN